MLSEVPLNSDVLLLIRRIIPAQLCHFGAVVFMRSMEVCFVQGRCQIPGLGMSCLPEEGKSGLFLKAGCQGNSVSWPATARNALVETLVQMTKASSSFRFHSLLPPCPPPLPFPFSFQVASFQQFHILGAI